jgi:hypothetical protein
MPTRWSTVVSALALVWALVAAASGLREAWRRPADPMAVLEADFVDLARYMPPAGEIGYLERFENPASEDELRRYYAAQYALAPRVVARRGGLEFFVVARDTDRPGGDSRLAGYVEVGASRAGHRVFRRLAP